MIQRFICCDSLFRVNYQSFLQEISEDQQILLLLSTRATGLVSLPEHLQHWANRLLRHGNWLRELLSFVYGIFFLR